MAAGAQLQAITARIAARSADLRRDYLARMAQARRDRPARDTLACTNLAHAAAASPAGDKLALRLVAEPNVGIVSAYNDMLSAHQPFAAYPDIIKAAVREVGATAQVAGGVPAMCDGVTQGQTGMELSLFSRDVIALATAVALSHQAFDAVLCLGVCDKIVPGMLIGALSFGHLPVLFVPAGPMPSGLPNSEKAAVRQRYAAGAIGRAELLEAELRSYHAPGTCTFYGTANSNQMLMEFMGLHLPGTAFVNPGTPLRAALTRAAAHRAVELARAKAPGAGTLITPEAIVNGAVGLLATGGSTNHTLHLLAIARAAGILIDWHDLDELSRSVPLLARVYPNGEADVNQFHAAGGLAFVLRELISLGLLHADVDTVAGRGLARYAREPFIDDSGTLAWREAPAASLDRDILRPAGDPFTPEGGLRLLTGNLGEAIIKVSAVKSAHRSVRAPARVFSGQAEFQAAFKAGELDRDHVAVVRHQGPRANGMPELHKLTPPLAVLQDRGFRVALLTDGRMSGASGKVPAAIHLVPEAAAGGAIARLRDGDMIRIDAEAGVLEVELDAAELARRPLAPAGEESDTGVGRELFALFRRNVSAATAGASVLFDDIPQETEPPHGRQ